MPGCLLLATAASVLEKILLVILSVTPLVMLFAPLYRAATGATWVQVRATNDVWDSSLEMEAMVVLFYPCTGRRQGRRGCR